MTVVTFLKSKGLNDQDIDYLFRIMGHTKKKPIKKPGIEVMEEIKDTICEYYEVDPDDIRRTIKKRAVTIARHLIGYFLMTKKISDYSDAAAFINRDRTTVLYGIQTVKNLCFSDPIYKSQVEFLDDRVNEIINRK